MHIRYVRGSLLVVTTGRFHGEKVKQIAQYPAHGFHSAHTFSGGIFFQQSSSTSDFKITCAPNQSCSMQSTVTLSLFG